MFQPQRCQCFSKPPFVFMCAHLCAQFEYTTPTASNEASARFHDIDHPTPPLSPEASMPHHLQAPMASDPFTAANPYVAADPFRSSPRGSDGGGGSGSQLPPRSNALGRGAAQRAAGLPEGLPPPGYPAQQSHHAHSPSPPPLASGASHGGSRGVPLDPLPRRDDDIGCGSAQGNSTAPEVAQLMSLTHEPEAQCVQMLSDHGFDLDRACDAFFNGAYQNLRSRDL